MSNNYIVFDIYYKDVRFRVGLIYSTCSTCSTYSTSVIHGNFITEVEYVELVEQVE